MIPSGVEVFISLDPVSMHLSFDRLAGLVEAEMRRSVRSASLFIFLNRRRTSLKALFHDGTGMCIFYKRIDRSRFHLPPVLDDQRVVLLTESALHELLDGLAITVTGVRRPTPPVH